MIKYQKSNPVGIDRFIDRLQVLQQREFPTLFGVSEATCLFYGRAELKNDNIIIFISGNDYEPIGFDDKLNFISYVVLDGNFEPDNSRDMVNVSFYCHGNLANIYSTITHRADEELRQDMKAFILDQIEPQDLLNIEIIQKELQPFHSFKINFKIVF
jgi:hypothetical protein